MSPISSRKSVPWCGQFEAADLARDGAGEGALLVAEELALQQSHGNGGAVDLDEGAPAPRAAIVNGAGDQLLAGAGFALDQHGRIGGRDRLHLLQHRIAAARLEPTMSSKSCSARISSSRYDFCSTDPLGALRELAMFQRILHADGNLLRHLPEEIEIVTG